MSLVQQLVRDAQSLATAVSDGPVAVSSLTRAILSDGYAVLAMSRVRQFARRWHIPIFNRALRLCQMTVYGIEIAKEAELGEGVNFMHTIGVIIGGDARIGDRTIFLGNCTIGNLNGRGYPSIGSDVVIGTGARILGPVTIGDGAKIGANAVVISDVPSGATAIGVPAAVRPNRTNADSPEPRSVKRTDSLS